MYAKVLSTDLWQGPSDQGRHIPGPSLQDIATAIERLDGKYHTLAMLKGDGDAHLAVGGGANGQYVVYATFDNVRFFTLISPGPPDSKVLLCVGGQEGDYSRNIVVDLPAALAAAKRFAETGQIDSALQWRSG
jgi:Immunity protein Imm1